jgi:hypothetical protein
MWDGPTVEGGAVRHSALRAARQSRPFQPHPSLSFCGNHVLHRWGVGYCAEFPQPGKREPCGGGATAGRPPQAGESVCRRRLGHAGSCLEGLSREEAASMHSQRRVPPCPAPPCRRSSAAGRQAAGPQSGGSRAPAPAPRPPFQHADARCPIQMACRRCHGQHLSLPGSCLLPSPSAPSSGPALAAESPSPKPRSATSCPRA